MKKLTLFMLFCAFGSLAQNDDPKILQLVNATIYLSENDPKIKWRQEFDKIEKPKEYNYNYEKNEVENGKPLGDLWVLKYQYKISGDPIFLKPIITKSWQLGKSTYMYYVPKYSFLKDYCQITPEDSLFTNPFRDKLIQNLYTDEQALEYFKNYKFKNPKNEYFIYRILADLKIKKWDSGYINLDGFTKFNSKEFDIIFDKLDYSNKKNLLDKRFELQFSWINNQLSINQEYWKSPDKCRDSLLQIYSKKLLNNDDKSDFELRTKLFKNTKYEKIFTTDYYSKLKDEMDNNSTTSNYLNKIALANYKNPKFTQTALEMVNKAIEFEEKADYLFTKAQILQFMHKENEAVTVLEKALAICGDCEGKLEMEKYMDRLKEGN